MAYYDDRITDPTNEQYGKKKVSNYFYAIDFKHRSSYTWELNSNLPKKMDRFFDYGITKIKIVSGYRTSAANDDNKGSKTSKHLLGMAADIDCYIGDTLVPCKYLCCLAAHIIGFNGVARVGTDGCNTPPSGQKAKDGYRVHVDVRTDGKYHGNERPNGQKGSIDYHHNVYNGFYEYFNLTETDVLNWFKAEKEKLAANAKISIIGQSFRHTDVYSANGALSTIETSILDSSTSLNTTSATASVDPVAAVDLTGEYKLVIENIEYNDITSNSIKIKAELAENFKNYKWSYNLKALSKGINSSDTETIKVKNKTKTFSITDLVPNCIYSLELLAKKSGEDDHKSNKIIFKTLQDYPKSVTSLKLKFEQDYNLLTNSQCTINFTEPDYWGYFGSNKGYRVILLLNGEPKITKDNFLLKTENSKKFKLKALAGSTAISFEDVIQIGVQTWVKDSNNNIILDDNGPKYSNPVYLKAYYDKVNKVYVKDNSSFSQAVLYSK